MLIMRRMDSAEARYWREVRSEARGAAYLVAFWYAVAVVGAWALLATRGDAGAAWALVQATIAGGLS